MKGFIGGICLGIAGMTLFPEGLLDVKYWLFTISLMIAMLCIKESN